MAAGAARPALIMDGKLLILHDSADFGGHERMLLSLLPGIVDAAADVVFCMPRANERLHRAIAQGFPGVRIIDWPFVKQRGEPYLHRLRWAYRAAVRRIFAAEHPAQVLLVQGRIEHLTVAMAALPKAARLISFLPMAHRMCDMGRSGWAGDRIRRALYRRPDHFIVPSEAVAAQVREAGGTGAITVAHNVVEPPLHTEWEAARAALDLPQSQCIALFLGRLEERQKGLDRLLAALRRSGTEALRHWTFVFVGEGEAAVPLQAAADAGLADIRLVPWTDRPDLYLSAADVLLLPSRWEGVPLVMLEAMQLGLPILASDIDVFRLYLPASNRVDFDQVDLPAKLAELSGNDAASDFAAHAAARLEPLTMSAARASFAAALA